MAFTAGSDWGVNSLDFRVTKYLSTQDKRHDVCNVFLLRVPGEIKRSRDLRGGSWSWTLKFAQKRS